MTKDKDIKTAVPPLRFPEFENIGEWRAKMLENILHNQSSQIALNKLQFIDDGYPVYGADGLAGFISDYTQEDDYIAIVKDGSGVGRLTLHKGRSSVLGTLNCLTSKDKDEYILTWLYYLLQTINFSSYVKGSGIPHIYYSDYKNHIVYLPNPKEQTKIADCLSSLDDLINAVASKIESLKRYKKSLMQQLFPADGETIPTLRFPEFQNAGEWEETTLDRVAEIITGNTPSTKDSSNYGGEKLFVSPADISDERYVFQTKTKLSLKGFSQARYIKENSILFVCIGSTIGKIAQNKIECATNQQINSLVPYEGYSTDFLYSILENYAPKVAFMAGNHAVPIINKTLFSSVSIMMPREREQKKIGECFLSIDALISAERGKLYQLEAHKKGLMQQLFPATNS